MFIPYTRVSMINFLRKKERKKKRNIPCNADNLSRINRVYSIGVSLLIYALESICIIKTTK